MQNQNSVGVQSFKVILKIKKLKKALKGRHQKHRVKPYEIRIKSKRKPQSGDIIIKQKYLRKSAYKICEDLRE